MAASHQLELFDRVLADVLDRFVEAVGHEEQLQIAALTVPAFTMSSSSARNPRQ